MSNVSSYNGPLQFCPGFAKMKEAYAQTTSLLMGAGTSSLPLTDSGVADKNFMGWWVKSTASSGTTRGEYFRLYLTGGAGGEALRVFTTVSSDTPADTVNGSHTTLSFGATTGNVTGLATAGRFTLQVPNRALAGTTAAVKAELYAEGTSSSNSGTMSFIRATLGGNATGAAAIEDTAYLVTVTGGSNASGNVVGSLAGNEPTWASHTGLIRVNLNGTVAYLVAVTL